AVKIHQVTRILYARKSGGSFHARITAPLVCGIAITATVFLIAIEYLMVSGLNRELVVTVLGNQVRVALVGAQVLLVVLVALTALLTVWLCTSLLLRGRRDELALLAKVGWEQRHVLLRLLQESWKTGALSGAAGAILALGVIVMGGSLPPLWIVGGVLAVGPLLGVLLASVVVYTLAQRELKSVYLERA
ncbi:MAG TPA: FtsX-like permease family protein, partial [Ktedonobacteraceae bacterium]|nr:FtsX-like permease family protein [Ktedonobacteraceae bacterium]